MPELSLKQPEPPLPPLKWEPGSISPAALKQLEVLLDVAVRGSLLAAEDSEKMLKILRLNPHARLGRMGQRLSLIEASIAHIRDSATLLDAVMDREREELRLITEAVEWLPTWRGGGSE